MARKKSEPLYTDLASPDDVGNPHFEEGAAKAALSSDSAESTYESVDVPGAGNQVEQRRGEIK